MSNEVTLAECPVGLFHHAWGALCFKSKYGNNDGQIDAYIVSTGEFFWGDHPQNIARQRMQLVTPYDPAAEIAYLKRQLAEAQEVIAKWKAFDLFAVGLARAVDGEMYSGSRVRAAATEGYRAGFADGQNWRKEAEARVVRASNDTLRAHVEAKDAEIASLKAERDLERAYKIAECHRCEDYADDRKALRARVVELETALKEARERISTNALLALIDAALAKGDG